MNTDNMNNINNQSSISLSKNSRGVTWDVKAYGETPEDIESKLRELIEIARTKEKQLLNNPDTSESLK